VPPAAGVVAKLDAPAKKGESIDSNHNQYTCTEKQSQPNYERKNG
jgi:hypothetical protein